MSYEELAFNATELAIQDLKCNRKSCCTSSNLRGNRWCDLCRMGARKYFTDPSPLFDYYLFSKEITAPLEDMRALQELLNDRS